MRKESVEIALKLEKSGDLVIPAGALERLNQKNGARVRVRVMSDDLSADLRKRNVSEEEIERVAILQLEPRENVLRFLATEGSMAGKSGFKKRAGVLRT